MSEVVSFEKNGQMLGVELMMNVFCCLGCVFGRGYRKYDINREVVGLNERHFILWPFTELIIGNWRWVYGAWLWTECYCVKCWRWFLLKRGEGSWRSTWWWMCSVVLVCVFGRGLLFAKWVIGSNERHFVPEAYTELIWKPDMGLRIKVWTECYCVLYSRPWSLLVEKEVSLASSWWWMCSYVWLCVWSWIVLGWFFWEFFRICEWCRWWSSVINVIFGRRKVHGSSFGVVVRWNLMGMSI